MLVKIVFRKKILYVLLVLTMIKPIKQFSLSHEQNLIKITKYRNLKGYTSLRVDRTPLHRYIFHLLLSS